MISVHLSTDEAAFLAAQLTRHLEELDNELIHTDKRALQAALASDTDRLRALRDRINAAASLEVTEDVV